MNKRADLETVERNVQCYNTFGNVIYFYVSESLDLRRFKCQGEFFERKVL